ncbi:MAG: NUDIX hydrolase [Bdellovibrionales bacterium]|nr:NUDIX hydrolase [Bdellovibrionales bacterium]
MTKTKELAIRLRQAVQGCTLHLHGPVQAWHAIEKACFNQETSYRAVAEEAITASVYRINELKKTGVRSEDPRIIKEEQTRDFIRDLLWQKEKSLRLTPQLAVDVIVFKNSERNEVVLIERAKEPYGWALPGGFVEWQESVEAAAQREIHEEIGIELSELKQFHVFSNPDRDPRSHVVSVVFTAIAKGSPYAADEVKKVEFFSLSKLPELAFDHNEVLALYRQNHNESPR